MHEEVLAVDPFLYTIQSIKHNNGQNVRIRIALNSDPQKTAAHENLIAKILSEERNKYIRSLE
jgi:hypothetical protein